MDITILKPRLDVTFKEGPVPKERGSISPIRQHWENFVNKLEHEHTIFGDRVKIIEMPLWQMTKDVVFKLATQANIIYIPHKQKFEYKIDNAMFYMQTVFPDFFTVDHDGWGAHMSYIPMDIDDVVPNEELWTKLKTRIKNNVSKFDQPNKSFLFEPEPYWVFVCQIPHDQVILQSSNISVSDALRKTIALAKQHNRKVFVKGHPVNPGAMFELKTITWENEPTSFWFDNISIHSIIENAEAVFMVNSGVGFETMLHNKPIVTFGDSEYKSIVNVYNGLETSINMNETNYKKFITAFFSKLFYTGDVDGDFYRNITFGHKVGRY